jgi:hypothetical protein
VYFVSHDCHFNTAAKTSDRKNMPVGTPAYLTTQLPKLQFNWGTIKKSKAIPATGRGGL